MHTIPTGVDPGVTWGEQSAAGLSTAANVGMLFDMNKVAETRADNQSRSRVLLDFAECRKCLFMNASEFELRAAVTTLPISRHRPIDQSEVT